MDETFWRYIRIHRHHLHNDLQFKEDIKTLLACTVIWTVMWLCIKWWPGKLFKAVDKKHEVDLQNRYVSLVHGFGAIIYGTYHFVYVPPVCGSMITPLQRYSILFSISYFMYDLVAMYIEGLLDFAMSFHHILVVFAFMLPLYDNIMGDYTMLAIFFTEISNPPMHLRHILRSQGKRYTLAYEAMEIVYVALYIVCRGALVVPVSYNTIMCPENHLILKISCSGLTFQAYYFIF